MKPILDSLEIGNGKNFTYLIACPETFDGALIDPSFEFDRVIEWVQFKSRGHSPKIKIKYLIATHGHWDHAGGFPEMLKRLPDAKVVANENERGRLTQNKIPMHIGLKDGDDLEIGNLKLKSIHSPGHTEGGACYILGDKIFTGDTLFVGYVGRTDFPGGSDKELYESLNRLKKLPADMIVYPGHDYGVTPTSTIKKEMATNPAMVAKTFEEFLAVP